MKKRMISRLLCLCLLVCLAVSVCAAGATEFLRNGQEMQDWALGLYGRPLPEGGTLRVTADSQTLEAGLYTVGEMEMPVTIYCLMDATTAIDSEQQLAILTNISSRMRSGDNMVLATFDETWVDGSVVDDPDVINATAQTVSRRIWKKNLYQAVVQALDCLDTEDKRFYKNKVLLILSDGNDSGESNVTEKDAMEAIAESTVPVYSVSVSKYANKNTTSYAQHLKSLSDASLGGAYCFPAEEKISAANAAEKVWDGILDSSFVVVNLQGVEDTTRDFTLRIRYETGNTIFEDTRTIYAADLPQVAQSGTELTAEEGKTESSSSVSSLWIWVAVGVAVVGIAVAAVIMLRKKPEARSVQESAEPIEPVEEASGKNADDNDYSATMPISAPQTPPPVVQDYSSTTPIDGCRLEFVALMHPDVQFTAELTTHTSATFGRDNRANHVLNPKDANLSGVHFEAEWDGSHLYLRDKGSTNGTKLNGGLCQPQSWIPVEDGSVLNVGSYEYRISIFPNSKTDGLCGRSLRNRHIS